VKRSEIVEKEAVKTDDHTERPLNPIKEVFSI